MNRVLTCALAALVAATLSGCGRSEPKSTAAGDDSGDTTFSPVVSIGSLGISRNAVTIRPQGEPEARVRSGGRLEIDGREVEVTEAQRAELEAYHAAAMQLREHGKQTGIAGAKVGVAAVGAVISGLAKGDPDSIGPKVAAEAERVKQAARKLCEDIGLMRQAQDALAADLAAFRPYATIDAQQEADCRSGLEADGAAAEPAEPEQQAEEVPLQI
jgi:hypothetical protein